MPQAEINNLLVHLGRSGKRVVRLKGGDPFIFGRGGEEAEALAEAGLTFEIVPGVSAASGCSAYAGIPLTHRDFAQGVRYITGHVKDDQLDDLDWRGLAEAHTTLVVYMGLANAGVVSRKLRQHGLASDTPVAAIENGSTEKQRVALTTLAKIEQTLVDEKFVSPTLLVIGKVAALAEKLSWFAPRPAHAEKRGSQSR